jgi:hypothetical protein
MAKAFDYIWAIGAKGRKAHGGEPEGTANKSRSLNAWGEKFSKKPMQVVATMFGNSCGVKRHT